jgi:tyrosyl-tRNA synthetase
MATAAVAPTTQTTAPQRNPYDILAERGFVYQCSDTEGLRRALAAGPLTAYYGVDPTAPSLQIGNIVPLMALAHLQRAGHRVIVIVGGGTAMIGDPTDRSAARRIMSREEIQANAAAARRQLAGLLDLTEGRGLMVDNAEWLLELKYIEFLRDYGRYFSVNEMLRMETYRTRLEEGLTFLEFNYALLQAYDFLELYRRYGCTLQVGGSDQWANILAGVDLIRRAEGALAFALTTPIITDASGQKMGKTAGGQTVWLDPELMSPYDFYQYWINTDDRDVARYLAIFTFLPMDEIRALTSVTGEALRPAKERLAFEVTRLIHGEALAREAQAASRLLFGRASEEDLAAAESVPSAEIDRARLEQGIAAVDLLVETGLAGSKSAARRLIEQGGAYLHGERLQMRPITTADLRNGILLLRKGKKHYLRVVPTAR